MNLYEITSAISKLEDLSESTDITEYLDSVQLQLNDKVNNIVKFERNLSVTADAISIEIERLSKLKTSYQNKAKSLKDYLSYSMTKNNITKIETDIAKLSFRKSEAVNVTDEALIPVEYITVKEVRSVDKLALKKALKEGAIPGAQLETRNNLIIK